MRKCLRCQEIFTYTTRESEDEVRRQREQVVTLMMSFGLNYTNLGVIPPPPVRPPPRPAAAAPSEPAAEGSGERGRRGSTASSRAASSKRRVRTLHRDEDAYQVKKGKNLRSHQYKWDTDQAYAERCRRLGKTYEDPTTNVQRARVYANENNIPLPGTIDKLLREVQGA